MKKGLITGLIVVLLIGGLFVLTGCNKNETTTKTDSSGSTSTTGGEAKTEVGSSSSTIDKALVGSWKNNSYGSDYVYTFNADGTGKYDVAGTIMEFTFTTSGSEISILYTGNTDPFETTYSINGTTLNVVDSLGKDTLYEKVN